MDSNLLEKAVAAPAAVAPAVVDGFNPNVHQVTEHGDPVRNENGSPRLKTNWETLALDRQGRQYNPTVHGDKKQLDDDGYLTVIRRGDVQIAGTFSRTDALVDKHKETGYDYYLFNDDGGRLEQARATGWEPVVDPDGNPAQLNVGQARGPNTSARLHRKPSEWNAEDQAQKIESNKRRRAASTAPNVAEGQYEATPNSPLK